MVLINANKHIRVKAYITQTGIVRRSSKGIYDISFRLLCKIKKKEEKGERARLREKVVEITKAVGCACSPKIDCCLVYLWSAMA